MKRARVKVTHDAGMPTRRMTALVLLAAILALALTGRRASAQEAQGGVSVMLLPMASQESRGPVKLGTIARLSGEVGALGDLVIVPDCGAVDSLKIELEQVRGILSGERSVNLGRVRLSGSVCTLRIAPKVVEPAKQAAAPATTPAAVSGDRVRDRLAARLSQMLDVPPEDLRLTLEAQPADVLDRPVGALTCLLQPTGSGDRIPFQVKLLDHDRVMATGSARATVLIRRTVMVATRRLTRGATFTSEDFTTDERWLAPSITPAALHVAPGQVVRGNVDAGEVIEQRDLEPPIVVHKGDLVAVDCVSGGVVVRATVRATESGREGDVISLQSLKGKAVLRARISGPGQAVLVVPEAVRTGAMP